MYRIDEKDGEKCVVFYDSEDPVCGMNEYPVLFSELDWFGNHFGIKQSEDFDAFLEALDAAWLKTLYKSENDEYCMTSFPTFHKTSREDMERIFFSVLGKFGES